MSEGGSSSSGLLFADLAPGRRFVSREIVVSAHEISSFAGLYDPQPFHLSDAGAAGTVFDGLAASGWHTAALTMRLLVESVPIVGGLVGLGGEIGWPAATRPGDRLHVECEVVEARASRSRPAGGVVTCRTETLTEAGVVVQVLVSKLLVRD